MMKDVMVLSDALRTVGLQNKGPRKVKGAWSRAESLKIHLLAGGSFVRVAILDSCMT